MAPRQQRAYMLFAFARRPMHYELRYIQDYALFIFSLSYACCYCLGGAMLLDMAMLPPYAVKSLISAMRLPPYAVYAAEARALTITNDDARAPPIRCRRAASY